MLASPVTVPEVGVQIFGNGSVVGRLWKRGARSKPGQQSSTKFLSRSWHIFSLKDKIGFSGNTASVASIQLCCCDTETVTDHREMHMDMAVLQ